MPFRTFVTLGASALVMGMTMVGCASTKGPLSLAGARADKLEGQAADRADAARKAMAKDKHGEAVMLAESAVALDPDHAAHRALLGKAYLSAGRFESARQALSDALALQPRDGQAALNLALAQTALGDWDGARATLAKHEGTISPADRGLALALAGDPIGGIQLLGEAARDPKAPAKVRQNLALGLALAGKWQEAKAVAAIDLPPGEVTKRIMQWAAFARPSHASDQVAALLHVTPVVDQGQPVQLALNAPAANAAPIELAASGSEAYPAAPGEGVDATPVAAAASPIAVATSAPVIRFGDRQEVVQALPQGYAAPGERRAIAVAARTVPAPVVKSAPVRNASSFAKGTYFVQLGAYDNAGVARDAWHRMARRVPAMASMTPQGVTASTRNGEFYRLSVGGFAKGDAAQLCGQVKAKGGKCFVRSHAGEKTASWAGGAQMASR